MSREKLKELATTPVRDMEHIHVARLKLEALNCLGELEAAEKQRDDWREYCKLGAAQCLEIADERDKLKATVLSEAEWREVGYALSHWVDCSESMALDGDGERQAALPALKALARRALGDGP